MSGMRISRSQSTEFVEFIRDGDLEGVKRLAQGNNSLLKKKFGEFTETALHLAVRHGHEHIVKLLLGMGADICTTDHHLRTVLHTAVVETDGINIITLILQCGGVDVNAREGYGNTPVKLAAEKGNSSAVRLLMDKGADITIADNGENTTLHVTVNKGHKEVLEMLLASEAHPGIITIIGKQNKDKNTPLHLAVEKGSPEMVAMLLNSGAGATISVQNKQRQTPLELNGNGNKEIIDLLKNPDKAAEYLPKKAKPPTASEIGRGGSVETDSPANNPTSQVSLSETQGLIAQLPPNTNIHFIAENVIVNQQYIANVNDGNVAMGPGCQVVNAQDATANACPQPQLSGTGESHYHLNMTGGNASVGDYSRTNVGAGTPRTPSTAGSSDVPFSYPEAQENRDLRTEHGAGTTSGFPTENPSSLVAAEALPHPDQEEPTTDKSLPIPVQEESPADKSLAHPVQEESPADKSLLHPVQEESPADKSLPIPVQEESPADKSLPIPVQEESPAKKSLAHPVQEESPADKSMSHPTQEESAAEKSLLHPVQEECPTVKPNASLPYSVPEESPAQKPDEPVNSSLRGEDLFTSLRSIQTKTDGDVTLATDNRLGGEAGPAGPSSGNGATEDAKDTGAEEITAARTVHPVKNNNVKQAIGPSDVVGVATNSRTNSSGASRVTSSGAISSTPDIASRKTWQEDIGSGPSRRASPLSRSLPKEERDRLLQEVKNPPASEMSGLEQLCAVPESQRSGEESQGGERLWADVITGTSTTDVVAKGKNAGNGVKSVNELPRSRLKRSPGPPLQLFAKNQEPKSALVVEPNTNASQNMASSDVGASAGAAVGETACGVRNNSSTHARACSSSKEPSHRTERHAKEDPIPDGALPAETVARTTTPNGEALRRGDPARGEHSAVSSDNSNSETQSSANGDSTVNQVKNVNPEDDPEGHKTCEGNCYLM